MIDGATTIMQILKSITYCYLQYQQMVNDREQKIPIKKFNTSFVLFNLSITYLIGVSFYSTSWAVPVVGGYL